MHRYKFDKKLKTSHFDCFDLVLKMIFTNS